MLGLRFGRLCVLRQAGGRAKDGSINWICDCDCGRRVKVNGVLLRKGDTTSCGCYVRELTRVRSTKHGKSRTVEYRAWSAMITRCENFNGAQYKYYGLLGIKVCRRWRVGEFEKSGFECFLEDMGYRPVEMESLDRFPDTAGDYEPGNVRWATTVEQNRNKRSNVTYKGTKMTLKQAVGQAGVVLYATAFARVKRGWSVQAAVEIPADMRRGAGR